MRFLVFSILCFLSAAAVAQGPTITVTTTPGKMRMGQIEPGSLYEKAGLQYKDVIREIDGKKVDDNTLPSTLDKAIHAGKPIKIDRKGKLKILRNKPIKDDDGVQEIPVIQNQTNDPD